MKKTNVHYPIFRSTTNNGVIMFHSRYRDAIPMLGSAFIYKGIRVYIIKEPKALLKFSYVFKPITQRTKDIYGITEQRKVVYDYMGDANLKFLIDRIKYEINFKLKHGLTLKYNRVFLNS